jgi:hypothetical protein
MEIGPVELKGVSQPTRLRQGVDKPDPRWVSSPLRESPYCPP